MNEVPLSPNIVVLQARLLQPNYQAPGRWALFNTSDRRSYVAMGVDKVPDLISLLESAATGVLESRERWSEATRRNVERLDRAGLLGRNASLDDGPAFLRGYHRAVSDYVFRSYFDDDWAARDRQLMSEYDKLWPTPPRLTPRIGDSIELPNVEWSDIGRHSAGIELIAVLLRFSLGPTGLIPGGDFGPWYRKTSPSGGAKHPTEARLQVGTGVPGLDPGSYIYDVQRHRLIKEDSDLRLPDEAIRVVLRLRVERPMWRYREIRSFRPVLIDAGHVAETIQLLAGCSGIPSRAREVRTATPLVSELEEPSIIAVDVGTETRDAAKRAPVDVDTRSEARYLTNPAAVFSFDSRGMMAEAFDQGREVVRCSLVQFWALSHALPSRRGDRDISIAGIRNAVGASSAEITELIEGGLLLPEKRAKRLYNGLDLWVKHGWYLSYLAHCAAKALPAPVRANPLTVRRFGDYEQGDLVKALQSRRTTRSFTSETVDAQSMARIEAMVVDHLPEHIDIVVLYPNGREGTGLLRRWAHGSWLEYPTTLSRDDVRQITIGQKPAGEARVSMWIVTSLDFAAGDYELRMTELGSVGQRAVLAAAAEGVGAFVTPALNDTLTLKALSLDKEASASAVYYIGFGLPKRGAPNRE